MSRGFGVRIITSISLRGATRAKAEAEDVLKTLDQIEDLRERTIPRATSDLKRQLRMGLDVISVLQLARFTMEDLSDLVTGKGGLGDILSLATSSILLLYRLQTLLEMNIALGATLQTIISSIPLGPVGLALGVGALVGGLGAYYLTRPRGRYVSPTGAVEEFTLPYYQFSRESIIEDTYIGRSLKRDEIRRTYSLIE